MFGRHWGRISASQPLFSCPFLVPTYCSRCVWCAAVACVTLSTHPQVQDIYAAALEEDPNAFEYDSLYDSMQEQKAAPKQQEKLARRPKYIASLLEQAEVRKREQGITNERVLVSVGVGGSGTASISRERWGRGVKSVVFFLAPAAGRTSAKVEGGWHFLSTTCGRGR
jgi:Coiled-coil domain-containing protein 55 (DUF2040)